MISSFKEWLLREAEGKKPFDPQQFNLQRLQPVQWYKTSIAKEYGELQRSATALQIDLKQLVQGFQQGKLVPLDDNTWSNMDNTDSTEIQRGPAGLQQVMSWTHRDVGDILSAFQWGGSLPSPIVLMRQGEKPYCMAGNTRLTVCKVLGVRPQVLMIQMQGQ